MSSFTKEQLLAINTINNNVVVSAGAGSGKTRVLVKRFVNILEETTVNSQKPLVNADEILAITFTRKAASEMKQRVRKELEEKISFFKNNSQGFIDAEEDNYTKHSRLFWLEQLRLLERAQISTIHSLCSRILRENPVEAQLDPNFTLAEDFEGEEFLEDCLQEYIRQSIKNDNLSLKNLLCTYGFTAFTRQLSSLIPDLKSIAAIKDITLPYSKKKLQIPKLQEDLCLQLTYLITERCNLTKTGSKGRERLDNIAGDYDKIIADIRNTIPRLNTLNTAIKGLTASGKLKDPLNELKKVKAELENSCVDVTAIELVKNWQFVIRDLDEFIQKKKQENDILTYDDLEILAVRLLENNEQIRKKYHQKFKYLMIDEFQDTNELQRELIYLLCGDDKNKLTGKKLFIVGDPKQSIYRFRGADVNIFANVRKEIENLGGEVLSLNQNFRSEKNILDLCNKVFEPLLGVNKEQNVYFEALQPFFERDDLKPELHLVNYDKNTGDNKYIFEGKAIAQKLWQINQGINNEGIICEEKKVPYGQMAILVRAMTHVEELAQSLKELKIPFKIIDGRGFYECQEIIDLLHVFIVLHNKYRDLELAGLLRSPYFGLSDLTITKLFLQKKSCLWDAVQFADFNNFDEEKHLLQRAARILNDLRKSASLLALPELLEKVWSDLGVVAVLSLQDYGENKLANAVKLRDLALKYSIVNSAYGTLGNWLDYVSRLRRSKARETAANVTDDNSVQIMTIHKSKGLQFHTVVLPLLADNSGADISECKFIPEIGLGIKTIDEDGNLINTGVLQDIKNLNNKLELSEKARLFYVAMTRAESRLLLTGIIDNQEIDSEKDLQKLSWLDLLQIISSDKEELMITHYADTNIPFNNYNNIKNLPLNYDERMLEHLPEYSKNARNNFSASALQTYLHCQRQYYYHYVMNLPELEVVIDNDANKISAKTIGLIVHRALEIYKGNIQEAFIKAANEYAPGQSTDFAKKLFANYVESDLYKNLPTVHRKEISFSLPYSKKVYFTGIIDFLGYTANDEIIIVDYKTGLSNDELNLNYAYQLAIYKYAVEQMLGKKVNSVQLHFLRDLKVWTIPTQEIDQYLQDVINLCQIIMDKEKESDFICNINKCTYCPYKYLCKQ